MKRVSVYLGAEEMALLDREVQETGASRSELIRRAIRSQYGRRPTADRLAALQRSAGSWRNRPFDGAGYVDAVRGDLTNRLRHLGLD